MKLSFKTALTTMTIAAALGTSGCQFPGFETGPKQTAALPAPPPPPKPPEERGIWIVGSAALQGPVTAAADRFGGGPDTRPRLVAKGVPAGFRQFCGGVGLEFPDMVASDRPIRPAEMARCRKAGITVTEYDLGPKRYLYAKDAHMMAVPGVRDFTRGLGVPGKPVDNAGA